MLRIEIKEKIKLEPYYVTNWI